MRSNKERESRAHQLGHVISIVTKTLGWQELEEASRNFLFEFALRYGFLSKYKWWKLKDIWIVQMEFSHLLHAISSANYI